MALVLCPKCKAEISSLSLACLSCGAPQSTAPKAMTLCPKCNAEISSLSLACPACGASLAGISRGSYPNVPTGPARPFFDNFWGMLTAPQTTFEEILASPRTQGIWVMLFLSAFFDCLGDVIKKGEFWYLLVFPLVALISYPVFLLLAWIFSFTGKWMGGEGDLWELFDGLIWASAPSLAAEIFEIIRNLNYSGLWRFGWGALELIAGVWSFIVLLLVLARVHRFSVGFAFLNMILVLVVTLVPLAGLYMLIRMVVG